VGSERRYVVRFTLMRGDVVELPFSAGDRVRGGDVITVSGWRVSIDSVAENGNEHSSGLLIGHLLRTKPPLGPPRMKKPRFGEGDTRLSPNAH
jgi:hypothetical protein